MCNLPKILYFQYIPLLDFKLNCSLNVEIPQPYKLETVHMSL